MTDEQMEAVLGEPIGKKVMIFARGVMWRRAPEEKRWEPYPEDAATSDEGVPTEA